VAVLNTCGTDGLARATAQTTINVESERRRVLRQFTFLDGAHQVDSSPRAIVLVTGENVRRTRFEAKAAMYAGQQFLFFGLES